MNGREKDKKIVSVNSAVVPEGMDEEDNLAEVLDDAMEYGDDVSVHFLKTVLSQTVKLTVYPLKKSFLTIAALKTLTLTAAYTIMLFLKTVPL